jgi:hypothetical protein
MDNDAVNRVYLTQRWASKLHSVSVTAYDKACSTVCLVDGSDESSRYNITQCNSKEVYYILRVYTLAILHHLVAVVLVVSLASVELQSALEFAILYSGLTQTKMSHHFSPSGVELLFAFTFRNEARLVVCVAALVDIVAANECLFL